MREEIKNELVAALRSGEYQQGTGRLKGSVAEENGVVERHCCLGVLCDIARKQGVGDWNGYTFMAGGDQNSSVLPDPVQEWAGFKTNKGRILGPEPTRWRPDSLMNMNDIGHSFTEIADMIEKEWEHI